MFTYGGDLPFNADVDKELHMDCDAPKPINGNIPVLTEKGTFNTMADSVEIRSLEGQHLS